MDNLHEQYQTLLDLGMPKMDGTDFFGLDYHELKYVHLQDKRTIWYIEDVECDLYGDEIDDAINPQERVVIPKVWVKAILTMHALNWAVEHLHDHYWWSSEGDNLNDLMICKKHDGSPLNLVVGDAYSSKGLDILAAIITAVRHVKDKS